MQDSGLRKKTEEIQSFADRKDMKKFHDVQKNIMAQRVLEPPHCSVQIEALFSQIEATLKRWAEHFNSVLNRPFTVSFSGYQ